jgi:hypothetical protein
MRLKWQANADPAKAALAPAEAFFTILPAVIASCD